MALQDTITQIWVKVTGKKINPNEYGWLVGPIGSTDIIMDKFIYKLAEVENLSIVENSPNFGLIEHIENIGIQGHEKKRLNKRVLDFYENTSNYDFEICSECKRISIKNFT